MPAEKKIVLSYLRFSTAEQLKGDSMRRQTAASEKWAADNGYTISERFNDQGVSGFKGHNRQFGAFARLAKMVEDGELPKGRTILLVEAIDRLSRDNVTDALTQFLNLINAGLEIVTLIDGMRFTKAICDSNPMLLMMSIVKMQVANEESAKKSHRLGKVWEEKRRKAAAGENIVLPHLPYWLESEKGKLVVDKAKADIVRMVFSLSLKGYGMAPIVKKFNREGIPTIGKRKHWQQSYISKLLHNKAVIGEYQPHTGTNKRGSKRVPIGDSIPGFFPAIIKEDTFYAVQAGLQKRKGRAGGPVSKWVNLFSGLLEDLGGHSIQVNDKGYGKRYVPSQALKGLGKFVGFPVRAFEDAFLLRMADRNLWRKQEDNSYQVKAQAITGKIKEVEAKIKKLQDSFLSGQVTESVVALLSALDAQKAKLLKDLDHEEIQSGAQNAIPDLRRLMNGDTQDYETRLLLRRAIAQLVNRIACEFKRVGQRDYIASTAIEFKDGRVIYLAFKADTVDRMKRDDLGHPIKGGAKGTPEYTIGILDEDDSAFEAVLTSLVDASGVK